MTEHISHDTLKNSDHHGSVSSYVTGFVLSLIFTIVPYFLVTKNIMSGTTLLLIVLALAVIQMFVQIVFFLHLGRGPKPLYNIVFFGATAGLIVLVVTASILIMNNLYRNMSPQEVTTRMAQEENIAEINGLQTGACQGNKKSHLVMIDGNQMSPSVIVAKRCDTLSLQSADNKNHTIVFRLNDSEASYGGEYEVQVRSDRSKIITLNEIGTFTFLDSDNEEAFGIFTVEP